MGLTIPMPPEAKAALGRVDKLAEDITAIRALLERLVEIEEARS
jgi:hypothetical protein